MLSVIIPAFNEEEMISVTAETIGNILENENIPCEIIFVDDGSADTTWEQITRISKTYNNVRGVKFSRNFGKESAIMAGLSASKGDAAVVIDCDLQHPPEKIVEMYRLWEQGFQVVEGVKSDRGKEGFIHRFAAKTFYGLVSKATGFNMESMSDFKLLDRKAVNAIISLGEKRSFFRALSSWVGFKTAKVEFEVRERQAGTTKWSTSNLTKYAVRNITSFSTIPMQLVTFLGILCLIISAVIGSIALYQKIAGIALEGFTTVIILQLFTSSIIMLSIGIVGYYIARIFEEVKNRPLYIISEETECSEKADK